MRISTNFTRASIEALLLAAMIVLPPLWSLHAETRVGVLPDPSPVEPASEASYFPFLKEGRYGLIDRGGAVRVAPIYEAIDACIPDSVTAGWFPGAGGETFRAVMALRACYPVRQPLIRVRSGMQWGYVNGAGEEVITAIYQAAGRFSHGLARVRRNGKWGYIDTAGRTVIEPAYDAATDFFGVIAAVGEGGHWRLINRHGALLGDVRFDAPPAFEIPAGHEREFIPVRIGGKSGYITQQGELAIQPHLDQAFAFREGLANVSLRKRFGFIDRSGRFVIEPRFVVAGPFSEGRALAAERINKYGYIDKSGAWAVKPAYQYGFRFTNGLARVDTGKGWVCIDTSGKVVIGAPLNCGGIENGLVLISVMGRSGYADSAGKILIEPRFDQVMGFSEGFAAVAVGKKWGYVDRTGALAIAPSYDAAHNFRQGLALVEIGDELAYIGRDGRTVHLMHVPGYGASIRRF